MVAVTVSDKNAKAVTSGETRLLFSSLTFDQ